MVVARAIAELAETGRRHSYPGWSGPVIALDALWPAGADWLLHRAAGLTWSRRAPVGDNLDTPSDPRLQAVRGGWSEPGWNGLQLRDLTRALPLETIGGAALLGYLVARRWTRSRRILPT
jgi:hypothetical protein